MSKLKKQDIFFIASFGILYIWVSITSFFHLVDFFKLTNPQITLAFLAAIGLELGAAASLSAIALGSRINQFILWSTFIIITFIQMSGNMYFAYKYINPDYKYFIEVLGLHEEDIILQKRIVAIIQGVSLPIIALGFIHFLNEYVRDLINPSVETETNEIIEQKNKEIETTPIITEQVDTNINSEIVPILPEVINEPIKEEIILVENVIEDTDKKVVKEIKPKRQYKPRKKKDMELQIETPIIESVIEQVVEPVIEEPNKNKKITQREESKEKLQRFKDRTNLSKILEEVEQSNPEKEEVVEQLTKWQQSKKTKNK